GRMAVDRVAQRSERADQILALDPFREPRSKELGLLRKVAVAYRTRLSGTQAGGGARSLRGPSMARLPSPCHAVHRGLRILDLRAGDDSPPQQHVPPRCSRRL